MRENGQSYDRSKPRPERPLRLRHEGKMETLRKLRDVLQQRHRHTAPPAVTDAMRSDVEYNTAKYDELCRRTNAIRAYVLGYNRNALRTGLTSRLKIPL